MRQCFGFQNFRLFALYFWPNRRAAKGGRRGLLLKWLVVIFHLLRLSNFKLTFGLFLLDADGRAPYFTPNIKRRSNV